MSPRNDQTVILGVPVDNLDMALTVDSVISMVDQYAVDKKARLVATANVDFIVNANRKEEPDTKDSLRSILRKADLVTADGMPLVWLSQLLGTPLSERVTGADLVPELAKRAAEEGKSIYLLGGKDGSARATAKILQSRHPTLKIAGFSAPKIDLDDEIENIIEIARINTAQPDILLIALGNPKQEFWFERYRDLLKVAVSIGVGGTFEFIAGMTSRAPVWMQKSGLEWIYRITQDPVRLVKRYGHGLLSFNFMAVPLILANRVVKLFSRRLASSEEHPGTHGSAEQESPTYPRDLLGQIHHIKVWTSKHILSLDFSDKKLIQSSEVLALMKLSIWAEQNEIKLTLVNLGWLPRTILKAYRIADLLSDNISSAAQEDSHRRLTLAS